MRVKLTPLVLLLFGACCCSAQLQVTQLLHVTLCDHTVIVPSSTIDAFATQVGLSSSVGLCLSNTGTTAITITNITVTGSDFSSTGNVLPMVIQPGSADFSNVIVFTFAPTAAGDRTGQISLTDDASGSPQTFPLTGTGFTDFGLSMWPTEMVSNTQTITAGQRADYLMAVTGATSPPAPSSFNGTVSLSCSNLPPGASCTFSPSSISLQGGMQFMGFNANVSTTASGAASFQTPGSKLWYSFTSFLALVLALPRRRGSPKRGRGVALVACLLLALVASCGGGSSKTTPTPSGTFPFSVNASANGVSHSKAMVLVVK